MLTRQLLADLKLSVYSLELGCCREWWCFRNVCNPYNRLYLGLDGDAYVTHHGRRYHLQQDSLHLIPCWTQVDMELLGRTPARCERRVCELCSNRCVLCKPYFLTATGEHATIDARSILSLGLRTAGCTGTLQPAWASMVG